ncbi:MAG TPA: MGMT family protein [Longimicrobiales bacterium]|nr:MGMT family protein [Longimicrobiales bacterium]
MPQTKTNSSPSPFARRVVAVVRDIPRGRVATYGEVAAVCGSPRAARGVGAVLSGSIEDDVPWWRVVNRTGALTIPAHLGLRTLQRTRLEDEDVGFDARGRVDLEGHRWSTLSDEVD